MVARKSMKYSIKAKKNLKSRSFKKSKRTQKRPRKPRRKALKGGRVRKALGHTVTAVGRLPIAVVDAAGKSVSGVAEGTVDIANSVVNHTGKYISGKRSIVNMPSNVVKGTVGTVKGVGKGTHSVVTGLGSNIGNAVTGKRRKRGKTVKNRFNH